MTLYDSPTSKQRSVTSQASTLVDQANLLHQTLLQVRDAVVMIDERNTIIFFNPAAAELWGYQPEEVLGQNLNLLVPREHRPHHEAYVARNRNTGEDRIVGQAREVSLERKDGQRRQVTLSLSKIYVDEQIFYTAFVRDVTQQKKLEEENAWFRLAADHGEFVPWRCNLITRMVDIITTHPSTGEMQHEHHRREVPVAEVFEGLGEFLHPDDRERVLHSLADLLDSPRDFQMQYRLFNRDRSEWHHYEMRVRYGWMRDTPFLFGVRFNVTQAKMQEQMLRQTQLRAQKMSEMAQIGYWVSYHNKRGPSVISTEMRQLWEFDPQEMPSFHTLLYTRVHPDDRPSMLRVAVQLRKSNQEMIYHSGVYRLMRQDGSIRHLRYRLTCNLPPDIALFAVEQDITEQVQREQQLEEARREAILSQQLKSEFLANISHELRTPLHAILGFSELLLAEEIQPNQRRYLKNVQSAGDMLLRLINDLLDLAKLEAGKMELRLEAVSLKKLGVDLRGLFETKAQEKRLDWNVEVQGPEQMLLDRVRLLQVLLNLVNNAFKFTEQGFVYVRMESQALSDREARLRIEVQDSGIGIPVGEQARIFGSFEQTQGLNHAQYGGTGLGLAISQMLVKEMGGSVELTSLPDQGSTFSLTLPHVSFLGDEQALPQLTDVPWQQVTFQQGKVLLAVGEDITRNLLMEELVLQENLEVHEICDGAEVVPHLIDWPPDVILLDAQLPNLAGVELAKHLQDASVGRDIPLVYVGERLTPTEAQTFHKMLPKPIRYRDLIEVLQAFLPFAVQQKEVDPVNPETLPVLDAEQRTALFQQLDQLMQPVQKRDYHLSTRELSELTRSLQQLAESFPEIWFLEWSSALRHKQEAFLLVDLRQLLQQYPALCRQHFPELCPTPTGSSAE